MSVGVYNWGARGPKLKSPWPAKKVRPQNWRSISRFGFKSLHEINQGNPQHSTDLSKFQQVEAPHTGFVVANERLWLPQGPCHVDLPQTCLRTELAQEIKEPSAVGGWRSAEGHFYPFSQQGRVPLTRIR